MRLRTKRRLPCLPRLLFHNQERLAAFNRSHRVVTDRRRTPHPLRRDLAFHKHRGKPGIIIIADEIQIPEQFPQIERVERRANAVRSNEMLRTLLAQHDELFARERSIGVGLVPVVIQCQPGIRRSIRR